MPGKGPKKKDCLTEWLIENAAQKPGAGVDLRAGDLFVLLTDGITEAESPDGSSFEAERALEVVRAHREEPAREIVRHLREAVLAFADGVPARDDLTVVIGMLAG